MGSCLQSLSLNTCTMDTHTLKTAEAEMCILLDIHACWIHIRQLVHKVYPGSTTACVSRVHVFKFISAYEVYPGSTAICVTRIHVCKII